MDKTPTSENEDQPSKIKQEVWKQAGAILRQRRLDLNLYTRDVAARLDHVVSHSYIDRIEQGAFTREGPGFVNLCLIGKVYELSAADLYELYHVEELYASITPRLRENKRRRKRDEDDQRTIQILRGETD